MNKTLSKLDMLKKELDELKNEKAIKGGKKVVKEAKIDHSNEVKIDPANDIVGKYFSKQAASEFEMFADAFKHFNQTAAQANKIDILEVDKQIKKNLIDQLTAPVRWTQIMENMIADGCNEVVEVGPGKVLQGLFKKVNRDLPTVSAGIEG